MLTPFATVLLVLCAFLSTALFFLKPFANLEKFAQGKKMSEVKAVMEKKFEEKPSQGCSLLLYMFVGLMFTFIIEPIFTITAITEKIGYLYVAYGILIIIGLSWISFLRGLIKNRKKKSIFETIDTDNKETAEEDKVIKPKNPLLKFSRRFFFFIPDLYLWYLFFTIIGVIK